MAKSLLQLAANIDPLQPMSPTARWIHNHITKLQLRRDEVRGEGDDDTKLKAELTRQITDMQIRLGKEVHNYGG